MKTFLDDWSKYFSTFSRRVAIHIFYVLLTLALGVAVALSGLNLPRTSFYDVLEGRQMVILVLAVVMACVYAFFDMVIDFIIEKAKPAPTTKKQPAAETAPNVGA